MNNEYSMTNKAQEFRRARLAEKTARKIGLGSVPSVVESPEHEAYLKSKEYKAWLCSPAADQALNPNPALDPNRRFVDCIRDPKIALELAERRVAALKEKYGERINPGRYTQAVLDRAKKAERRKEVLKGG